MTSTQSNQLKYIYDKINKVILAEAEVLDFIYINSTADAGWTTGSYTYSLNVNGENKYMFICSNYRPMTNVVNNITVDKGSIEYIINETTDYGKCVAILTCNSETSVNISFNFRYYFAAAHGEITTVVILRL